MLESGKTVCNKVCCRRTVDLNELQLINAEYFVFSREHIIK